MSSIDYFFYDSIFGKVIIANSMHGICYLAFCQTKDSEPEYLQAAFPKAELFQKETDIQQQALEIINGKKEDIDTLELDIQGSDFQKTVWRTVMKIPFGKTATYNNIAKEIGKPKASRAVGNAIGKNKIAILIPCHRVICSSGALGGYKWNVNKKKVILSWEKG